MYELMELNLHYSLLLYDFVYDICACACVCWYEKATVTKWAREEKNLNVVLVSPDKDMAQLLGTGVHLMHPKSKVMSSLPRLFAFVFISLH